MGTELKWDHFKAIKIYKQVHGGCRVKILTISRWLKFTRKYMMGTELKWDHFKAIKIYKQVHGGCRVKILTISRWLKITSKYMVGTELKFDHFKDIWPECEGHPTRPLGQEFESCRRSRRQIVNFVTNCTNKSTAS